MRGLLAAGAIAAGLCTVAFVGYKNKEHFYDKRLGGIYIKGNICESFDGSIKSNPNKVIKGLDYPLESTVLVLVEEGTNNIIMSLGKRGDKSPEWTLVGGKAMSWKRTEDGMTDYSDDRFITKDGEQHLPQDCKEVVFENPRRCLTREVIEELTGEKYDPACHDFDWLVDMINNTSDWTFVKTNKKVKSIDDFHTYIGLCRVMICTKQIAYLNSQINRYIDREHIYFAAKSWVVKEVESNGKPKNRLQVNVDGDDYQIRKFNNDIMFSFYWKEFSDLIMKENIEN